VDIGVHQDGLVHISALSNRFVKDPREVVKAGDVVKVKVLEVDVARRRIALTMRLSDEVSAPRTSDMRQGGRGDSRGDSRSNGANRGAPRRDNAPAPANALAQAFARAKR